MGTLNVLIKEASQETNVFTASGMKRNLWMYYTVTVERDTQWSVVFEG